LPIQWLWLDDINLQRNEFDRVATLDVTEVTQARFV